MPREHIITKEFIDEVEKYIISYYGEKCPDIEFLCHSCFHHSFLEQLKENYDWQERDFKSLEIEE